MTRITFSTHAIERYIERHAPWLEAAEARERLQWAARLRSTKLKQKTGAGDSQWQLRDPDVVLVVRPDGGNSHVVTILPHTSLQAEDALLDDPGVQEALAMSGPALDQKLSNDVRNHQAALRLALRSLKSLNPRIYGATLDRIATEVDTRLGETRFVEAYDRILDRR